MSQRTRLAALALASAATMVAITSCSSGPGAPSASSPDTSAPVTISVGGLPSTEKPELRAAFERSVTEFMAENKNIVVEAEETEWNADTFQALLAGGTMPTTLGVPFTEIGALMERKQVAPISQALGETKVLDQLNPTVMEAVTDDGGEIYGVPVNAYTMGLVYNRALFTAAGLDPDDPPTTWEAVREAAQQIEEKTDAQGFQTMTLENTGGWVLTTMSYSFGSTMQSEDGTTATVDNPATAEVLEFYRQLRWEDNSMGENALVNYGDAVAAFAGGQVGMYVTGADLYINAVVNNGMAPEDFGVAPLPQADDGLGTLGGGFIYVVKPTATPEEAAAAAKWIEFSNFRKFLDEEFAVSDAETAAESDVPIGTPGLPVVNKTINGQYLTWIADKINVPRENFEPYLSTVEELPLVPEPKTKAQETYAALDSVVQAVLTREDADIPTLLKDAQTAAQGVLGSQ